MNKWESIVMCVLFLTIAGGSAFDEWQKKEAEKACYQAVTTGKGDIKDCKK